MPSRNLSLSLIEIFGGLLFLLILVLSCGSNEVEVNSKTAEHYQHLCASCHGSQLETFINRSWQYGDELEIVIESITKGRINQGMPSFSQLLNQEDINALAQYVIEAESQTIAKEVEKDLRFEEVLGGLTNPWAIAFLPDNSMLITEKEGKLLHYANENLTEISGLPTMIEIGQGGLMDVELHPAYETNGWIYLAFVKPEDNNKSKGNTAVARGKIVNGTWVENEILFEAFPRTSKSYHFGGRLTFDRENYLYVSVGDRGQRDDHPQYLTNHCGKIHRIKDNGEIPRDNPFYATPNAIKSIWSYGHRNPQGLATHPETGEIWEHEHGPRGGDELNLIQKGKNYGWPVISYGINYNGTVFTELTQKEGMEQPLTYWVPSIAPCGMSFLTSDNYPNWKNSIFMGSLSFEHLERCEFQGSSIIKKERFLKGIGRVRHMTTGPDGYLYVATERPGKILRILPTE